VPAPTALRLFLARIRERLGWPLILALLAALLIVLVWTLVPADRSLAAPAPPAPVANKSEGKTETPAMGDVSTEPKKKPSPAIPKKSRRR